MRIDALHADGRHPLTYCTNVHPAGDLDEAEAVYRDKAAPALRNALGDGKLCLGAWWPSDVAFALASDQGRLDAHFALCEQLGVVPSSLNVFPMGRFHGDRVKQAVYEPTWASEERLSYSLAAATALASLLQRSGIGYGVMSSLPLGFRGAGRDQRPVEAHAVNVFRLALALEALEKKTGVHVVLALEPEPWCLLETLQETVTWLVDEVMAMAASGGNEAAARRHIGICIDLCHAAVVGEDAIAAVSLCERSGVRIGKVQVSAAIVARGPDGLARLLEYDEPVYLHQTFGRGDRGPFVDLSDPGLGDLELGTDEELVSHFHVPIHWAGQGALVSTKDQVVAFLDFVEGGGLPAGTPLEVETYTNPSIAEELEFAARYLTGARG